MKHGFFHFCVVVAVTTLSCLGTPSLTPIQPGSSGFSPSTTGRARAGEQYEALVKEHHLTRERFAALILEAQSESDNQGLSDAYQSRLQWLAQRFMDLAQEHPGNPVALDAVAWVASHVPSVAAAGDVLRVLSQHPGQKGRIRSICLRFTQAELPGAETILRLVGANE